MPLNPERTDGYADLRGYAAIGDGRTVALIAPDGRIDWLPIPDLDSTPVFAALLDAENGGAITLEPAGPYTVRRRYLPGTNVLQTTFTTAGGVARVTDALVTGIAGRLPWVELGRRVEGVRGTVRLRWSVAPGTRFATASPWVDQTKAGTVIRVDGVTLTVQGSEHHPRRGQREITGTITASTGSRAILIVAGTSDGPVHVPIPEYTDASIDRTAASWRTWSREFHWDGLWASEVQRSALALKLLVFAPTGAIAAAATTSLPESRSGEKNWDYRFAWVRDLAYTVHALVRFGLREETHAAVAWLLRVIRERGSDLRVFYSLDGGTPDGVETTDLPGWGGIAPVVVGNRAGDQLQLGVFGDLFDVMRVYVESGNVLDEETGRMLAVIAERTAGIWREKDSGMWELEDLQHYTSSKMGCWQALQNAAWLCEAGQIPGQPERWRAECRLIEEWVAENCWSEDRQAYLAWPGSDGLDASVLLHAPSGFDRGKRMAATIGAIQSELAVGPLVYRFSGADQEEGAFVACSFWLASALACVGRLGEAIALMDELVKLPNDVGLLAEMIDPADSSFLGNLPQGLSHLALINAAITITQLAPQ